ncbi:Wzz/FepE/Etk N-terminal domain-containing protein [Alteromonas sp. ASW11-19]|uniref:Wzz/FepE/Etk N-terminal domain-containing protein n=1 Tax=Alteromonas salexigens TaxID=2982530 RepID=A0ABT2VUS9_9ALTE|nr:XrtA system polysaccharide chain length determinant [Alteromonas salexigens]MCU7555614.1 Wzz/FepE/Etk N-terminal domain-containing protein [Alteromonas salexigens]
MQDLQQTLNQVVDYIKGIWIKKRFVIICSWLFCPLGFIYVATLPDQFESESVVFVDTRSVLQPLLKGLAIQSDPDQEIQMMAKTLLSRSNVEKIARESDLDITATTDREFEDLIDRLSDDIELGSTGRDNIYTITYQNKNPVMAQRIVQETLDLFVEGALGNNRKDTDTAGRFLDEQIADYEARLGEAEQRLADFKRQYNDILPMSGTFYNALQQRNQDLETTQLEIEQTLQQVQSMKSKLNSARAQDGFGVTSGDGPVFRTRYDERIKALEEKLDNLRLRFTEQHPDVIETQHLLSSLEDARKEEVASYRDDTTDDEPMPTSELEKELRLEISRLEGQIASLKVKESSLKQKIAELESKVDLVPQIEAESSALNRDYDITKRKYEELLSRRESADLSRRADVSAEELQFRIIEPPLMPNVPSGPNRILLYTIVLLLGFGSGIALAFLVSQLSPVLVRARQLQTVTDYPIWGTVSHLNITQIRRRNRLRITVFALSSGAIICMYGFLVSAEVLNINFIESVMR